MTAQPRIADLVRSRMDGFSPAERRLAKVLLGAYPIAGLESIARLAERARVSTATVTRLVGKLGFAGYADFQDRLREEVQLQLSSPLARYEHEAAAPNGSLLRPVFASARHGLEATLDMIGEPEFEAVSELLADRRRRILVLGGRVTGSVARYLTGQLALLRPGALLLEPGRGGPLPQLVDLGRRDVLVLFDLRRYQRDTIESARVAARLGATVVLVTDQWLSPAAASARHVLVPSTASAVPFDSLVPLVALVEALIGSVLARLGEGAERRMRMLEELRAGATWGLEGAAAGAPGDGRRESGAPGSGALE